MASSTGNIPSEDSTNTFVIGTRRSQLARVQCDHVIAVLKASHPENSYSVHAMDPLGDRDKNTALYQFNAKSLWTHELEELLLDRRLDAIVHSLKDMPTQLPSGLSLGSIFQREDPRDALVLKASAHNKAPSTSSAHSILSSLPPGSLIGSSSLRRMAQLKRRYPNLRFADMRGNVPTRLRKLDDPESFQDQKVPEFAALILAAAGLKRLGLGDRISAYLSSKDGGVLHAVGQGALGVEIREDDKHMQAMLAKLGDSRSERACLAERSLMRTLEGGCSVPIGVETEWADETGDELIFRAVVVSIEGDEAVEVEERRAIQTAEDADEYGRILAQRLVDGGAAKILEKINLDRGIIAEQGGA